MTISVGNNKSNTNYRIIFSIIIGLLFSFSSQIVFAQSSVNVPSTSASAAADKGGGQRVTLKDGRVMSFGDIEKLSKEEKTEVLDNQMTDEQFARWEVYQKGNIQAANQAEKKIDGNIQAANQLNEGKREQLIGKYEQYISNIEKGAKGEKKLIEEIIASDITPEQLKTRAIALLNKKGIVLVDTAPR